MSALAETPSQAEAAGVGAETAPEPAPARTRPVNPNHNIWQNNGIWFLHYTVYPTPITKHRLRCSLRTRCVEEARRRRDIFVASLPPEIHAGRIRTGLGAPVANDRTPSTSP